MSNKEMNDLVDESMALVLDMTMRNNQALAKSAFKPKGSTNFNNDLLAMKRLQAFVEYIYAHQPSMFESAYRFASESVVDNE
tara:strand:+ start:42 stop:287 length:246 start_codon:yes stop_codon:yes gene_type:complete